VLGCSFDDADANRAFAEKFAFPFRLLCDTDRAIGTAYGAADAADAKWARRISYLIGPDRRIVRAYHKVEPAKHPEQVLADLSAPR
jgi:thioredoxin-dependent peroxiredoxin